MRAGEIFEFLYLGHRECGEEQSVCACRPHSYGLTARQTCTLKTLHFLVSECPPYVSRPAKQFLSQILEYECTAILRFSFCVAKSISQLLQSPASQSEERKTTLGP